MIINKGLPHEQRRSVYILINELPSGTEGKDLIHTEEFDNAFIEHGDICIKMKAKII